MSVESTDPPSFKPHPLYACVNIAALSPTTKLVTVAGQIGQDPTSGEVPSTLSGQVDICLSRLSSCLEHAGAKKGDVTRFMYYLSQRGIEELDKDGGEGTALRLVGGKVAEWLEGHRPAACFLRVFGMSEERYLVEFECMAVVSTQDTK
ncbi:hypothetical protein BT69DRAFT_1329153 [Atractiella rhizophila]|nr:hypothetical protein BT69DRAFT_1329153 [Atractiella rhizophila]